jgi:hypothetical protein
MIFPILRVLCGLSGKKILKKKMKNKKDLKFLLLPVTLLLLILIIHNIGLSNLYSTIVRAIFSANSAFSAVNFKLLRYLLS